MHVGLLHIIHLCSTRKESNDVLHLGVIVALPLPPPLPLPLPFLLLPLLLLLGVSCNKNLPQTVRRAKGKRPQGPPQPGNVFGGLEEHR